MPRYCKQKFSFMLPTTEISALFIETRYLNARIHQVWQWWKQCGRISV
jgi:hypothetical protein